VGLILTLILKKKNIISAVIFAVEPFYQSLLCKYMYGVVPAPQSTASKANKYQRRQQRKQSGIGRGNIIILGLHLASLRVEGFHSGEWSWQLWLGGRVKTLLR